MPSSFFSRTIGRLSPLGLLVSGFAGMIFLGSSALFFLPTTTDGDLSLIDALFTITSAVCVTGLTVLDTGRDFNLGGKIIIMLCFQAGGLGIMSFSAVIFSALGRKLSFRGRGALQESIASSSHDIKKIVRRLFLFTFLIEMAGVLLLWPSLSVGRGPASGFFHALFHSISAFCNAGFSLYSDSLIGFADKPAVIMPISLLIIFGGIGFVVLDELTDATIELIKHRRPRRLSLHTRVALSVSAALLVFGFISYLLLDLHSPTFQRSAGQLVLDAWFQSVTARTAGFNSVDYNSLSNAFLMITMFLMMVGGSPGSTAGGIKTTTAAVMFFSLLNNLRGRNRVTFFRRTIPEKNITRAIATATAAVSILVVAAVLLLVTELGGVAHAASRGMYLELLFEATSALGTVGLSLGATPGLSIGGKLIIIALMFIGRVGPLTLMLAAGAAGARVKYRYPEDEILVG